MASPSSYSRKPGSVRRLERRLLEEVVGTLVPYETEVKHAHYDVSILQTTDIASELEGVTRSYVLLDPKVAAVAMEPNGNRTFPDLGVTYRNNYRQTLEVKTWGKSRAFDVAKIKPLHESIEARNAKYFNTWYVQWSYAREDAGYRVCDVSLDRIWDICGWTKTLDVSIHTKQIGGHMALRPGSDNFQVPVDLLFAIVGTSVTDPLEQQKMFSQGLAMLRQEGLYSDADMLVLKNRVRGTIMREARHDFLFKF